MLTQKELKKLKAEVAELLSGDSTLYFRMKVEEKRLMAEVERLELTDKYRKQEYDAEVKVYESDNKLLSTQKELLRKRAEKAEAERDRLRNALHNSPCACNDTKVVKKPYCFRCEALNHKEG